MKIIQFIIPISVVIFISCKSPQQTAETPPADNATTVVATNDAATINTATPEVAPKPEQQMQNSKDTSYRFIVSFISIGEGTDRNAKQIMDSVLTSWDQSRDRGVKINFETVPWGREGEADFCFPLKELNPKEQIRFVSDVRSSFKGHVLVQFSENEACRHKR